MTIDEVEPYRAKEINEPYIMMGADVPNSPKRRYTSRSELLNATLPSDDEDGEENDTKDEVFETVPSVVKQISSESSSDSSEAEEEKHEEDNSEDQLLHLEEKIDVVISEKAEDKKTSISSESSESEENAEEHDELPEVVEEPKEEMEPEETAEDVAFKLMTRKPDKNDSILHETSINIPEQNETDAINEQNEIMEVTKMDKIEAELESEDETDHEVMGEIHVTKSSSSSGSSNSGDEQTELNLDDVELPVQSDSNEIDKELKESEPFSEEKKEITVREEINETKEPNVILEETEDIVTEQPESQFADESLGTLIQTKAISSDNNEITDEDVDKNRIEVNVEAEKISEVHQISAFITAAPIESLESNSDVKDEEIETTETFPEPPNLEDQNINLAVDMNQKEDGQEELGEVNKNQSMNETVSTLSSTFHRTSSVSSTSDSSAASFTSSNQTEDRTLEDKTEVEPEVEANVEAEVEDEVEPEDKKVSVKEEIAKLEERSVVMPSNEEIRKEIESSEKIEDASTSLVDTTISPDTTLASESSSNHEAITEDLASKTEEEIVTSLVEDALTRSESQLNGTQQTNADIVKPEEGQEDVIDEKADIIEDEKSKISLKDKIKFFKSEISRAEEKPAPEKIEPPRISRQVSLSQVFIFFKITAGVNIFIPLKHTYKNLHKIHFECIRK